jgi:AraC-like DNA-binding protein
MVISVLFPSEPLIPYVRNYFLTESEFPSAPPRSKLFPVPCIRFVFCAKGEVWISIKDKTFICKEPTINGLILQHTKYQLSTHTIFGGISFHPTGFYKLFGIDASELKNQFLPLCDFLDDQDYFRELKKCTSNDEYKAVHEKMLLKRLNNTFALPPVVDKCVEDIFENRGDVGMRALLEKYKCSRRYLEKHFATCLGTSPGKYSKLLRFHLVLKEIVAEQADTATILSQFRYYDLSHFIKDFEFFMEEKPQLYYRKERSNVEIKTFTEEFQIQIPKSSVSLF